MKEESVSRETVMDMDKAIPHEINLLYIISLACDAMIYDIERKMKAYDHSFCLKHEAKQRMGQYLGLLSKFKAHFDNFIMPQILRCSVDDCFRDFEDSRVFAQELIRLLMLYYEKCRSQENHSVVFDTLIGLEGGRGVFTDRDINRFDLGCQKEKQ